MGRMNWKKVNDHKRFDDWRRSSPEEYREWRINCEQGPIKNAGRPEPKDPGQKEPRIPGNKQLVRALIFKTFSKYGWLYGAYMFVQAVQGRVLPSKAGYYVQDLFFDTQKRKEVAVSLCTNWFVDVEMVCGLRERLQDLPLTAPPQSFHSQILSAWLEKALRYCEYWPKKETPLVRLPGRRLGPEDTIIDEGMKKSDFSLGTELGVTGKGKRKRNTVEWIQFTPEGLDTK